MSGLPYPSVGYKITDESSIPAWVLVSPDMSNRLPFSGCWTAPAN